MSVESAIKFEIGQVDLTPAPIHRDWIIEGDPVARNKLLSSSADGFASSYIWDCTAGRFNWFYTVDETIYVIEGGVVITDMAGAALRLSAGDAIFFPAGTHAQWNVEKYIRKFALVRTPVPRPLIYAKRGYKFVKRLVGADRRKDPVPAMLQSG